MRVGDIGIVTKWGERDDYVGHVILRHYEGYVSLTNPQKTWSGPGTDCRVRLLRPGTTLTVTE